jgi:L-lactate dehydrogenase (cytochrome)
MGQTGVTKTLEIIHKELDTTMGLCGQLNVAELNQEIILTEPGW